MGLDEFGQEVWWAIARRLQLGFPLGYPFDCKVNTAVYLASCCSGDEIDDAEAVRVGFWINSDVDAVSQLLIQPFVNTANIFAIIEEAETFGEL
jgi:hypothetical protein